MKTTSKIILTLVVIALVVFAFYAYKKPAVAPTVPGDTPAEVKESTKDTEALSVNITYPVIPGNTQAIMAANATIASDIDKRIASFENDANDSMKADIGLPKDIKSTVTGGPSIEEKNDRYVSIFMAMEWYLRGAAHPGHTIDTYVYDYKNQKLVSPGDMFKPGADYLTFLSQYSKQDLLNQSKEGDLGFIFDESMVNDGTKPTKDNFSRILPLKDGLMIYFNEYQVAPYAAGPQQVSVPYSALKDIINPDGVLGMYIK